ncbi:Core-2/I-Branching enzyme [Teladorsagia circumcincta]|uniref:Core-2/I-Branching enzyme n=1 Tax=Teladorsagia circumcincta TaxID=45464 RepID=A0A2G9V795_TELCI|nr:Core-2/I-Branching enzyme [Teladorsagia circumcincta]
MQLNCDPIISDTEDVVKYRHWTYDFKDYENELYKSSNICETINKYFFFEKRPLSREEEEYPLAFGFVLYKDIIQVGKRSQWGSYGILDNVYQCFKYLAHSKHNWKYYQYLSGSDLPLRTNLEMVRIMKALNGSINSDIDEFEMDRYRTMEGIHPPLPLYKSAMSVAMPRAAANYIVRSEKVKRLLRYLSNTWIPDESFWTSIAGNAPCQIRAWSCVFGVMDVAEVIKRPELIVHKLDLNFEPAAFMCILKEIRYRSHYPLEFDATSYSEMPTVELYSGKRITELTHPDWLLLSSFYRL